MTSLPRLIVFMLAAISLPAGAQQIQVSKDNRTISITATDTAKADADRASVHIGFTTYGLDANAAYRHASDLSNAIIAALSKAGVSKAAIESDAQSIQEQPVWQMQQMTPAEREQHRFLVNQTWTVSTKAKDAADIMNIAINAGANNSGQIDWLLQEEDVLQSEAAAKALERGRQIAVQMAKGLNATLGALVYASNEAPSPEGTLGRVPAGIGGMESPVLKAAAPIPLSISPRQVTKSATVYAVFALQ